MFNRIKHWLGIESIKIKVLLPEEQPVDNVLIGKVLFMSMSHQTVESLSVTLFEKYTQGRKKNKEKQTFELGSITLDKRFTVPPKKEIKITFKLPYTKIQSEMDDLAVKNIFLKGISKTAKLVGNVQSEYEIIAEADVQGAGLNPFDRVSVNL